MINRRLHSIVRTIDGITVSGTTPVKLTGDIEEWTVFMNELMTFFDLIGYPRILNVKYIYYTIVFSLIT